MTDAITKQIDKDRIAGAKAALLDYGQADEDGIMVVTSRQAIHEVHDALVAAEQRIETLERALKPFAREANMWNVSIFPETYLIELACDATCADCGSNSLIDAHPAEFSILDLRNARAALKGKE